MTDTETRSEGEENADTEQKRAGATEYYPNWPFPDPRGIFERATQPPECIGDVADVFDLYIDYHYCPDFLADPVQKECVERLKALHEANRKLFIAACEYSFHWIGYFNQFSDEIFDKMNLKDEEVRQAFSLRGEGFIRPSAPQE